MGGQGVEIEIEPVTGEERQAARGQDPPKRVDDGMAACCVGEQSELSTTEWGAPLADVCMYIYLQKLIPETACGTDPRIFHCVPAILRECRSRQFVLCL